MPKWEQVSGGELLSVLQVSGGLDGLIDPCQCVYAWKRDLTPPEALLGSAADFVAWIQRTLEVPYARTEPQILAHFIKLTGLELGGGPLTDAKVETLNDFVETLKRRRYLREFLSALAELAPPLYVGETNNVHTRLRQHLRGDTDFAVRLAQLGMSWPDVTFWYWPLGEASDAADSETAKRRRTMFELLAARFSIAACATRPG